MTAALVHAAFQQAGEAMVVADADLKVLVANTAFAELARLEAAQLQGLCLYKLVDESCMAMDLREMLRTSDQVKTEFMFRNHLGQSAPVLLSLTGVRDADGKLSHYMMVISDLMALAASGRKTGREVYFDALTGLPNRELLGQLMNESIEHARRRGAQLALCVLDVDHFKTINDTHGQEMGDQLITQLAHRISHLVQGDDILARIGGDEFALLLQQGADEETLAWLLNSIAAPLFLKGIMLKVTVSLGVALYPQDDVEGDVLLRHATQAMHRAKQQGRNIFHVFDSRFDRELQAREEQRRRFQRAITDNELRLHYQPQVDMLDGRIIGLEALVRWQHPERGLLPPGAFLPLIEGSSLDDRLGEWVLEAALQQLEAWGQEGVNLPINVNISPSHLLSEDFVERLTLMLSRHPEVPVTRLKLEILESTALSDLPAALETMRRCQELGIDFAIDDFGTGYSSLTHMRQLPVDLIKIDQSFVRDMLDDPGDLAIVESVIFMANRFKRPMLAEGVETVEHARRLLALGCTQAQGYGIAKPMPSTDLPAWLSEWSERHDWTALAMQVMPPPGESPTSSAACRLGN